HRLTHRLLLITPFAASANGSPPKHFSNGLWVEKQNLAGYGLPKPLYDFLHDRISVA
ncbi:MAG: A/G-specific adenine glycosylase, partial [Neisseria sp.]|nr:A/G-specific adenine glycosylase [Neisseria sp.]